MLIHSVGLNNFKSFDEAVIELPVGLTAIVGENGAGKSSILQAIGFALFGFLPHTRLACMRHGTSKTTVSVEFTSAHDGRRYRLTRTLRRSKSRISGDLSRTVQGGAAVYDVELGREFEHGVEEVDTFLARHLDTPGFASPADVFEHVVGVPQGRLTADFLDPPRLRQQRFDPVLRTAEFQIAFEALRELVQHFAADGFTQEGTVSTLLGQLDRETEVRRRLHEARQSMSAATREHTEAQSASVAARTEFERHEHRREVTLEFKRALDVAHQVDSNARDTVRVTHERVNRAAEAAQVVIAMEADHTAHEAARITMHDLHEVESIAAPLRETLTVRQLALVTSESNLRGAEALLAGPALVHSTSLHNDDPTVDGSDLPSDVAALREAHSSARARAEERRSGAATTLTRTKDEVVAALERLKGRFAALEHSTQELREKLTIASSSAEPSIRLDALQERVTELTTERATINALLAADQYARDLLTRTSCCPFFEDTCRNLSEIGDVTGVFDSRSSAYRHRLHKMDQELSTTQAHIATADTAQKHQQRADALRALLTQERARLDTIRDELESLDPVFDAVQSDDHGALAKALAKRAGARHLATEPSIDDGADASWDSATRMVNAMAELEHALANHPERRIAVALAEAARYQFDADQAALSTTEAALAAVQPDLTHLQSATVTFEQTRESNERYLRHIDLASDLARLQNELEGAQHSARQAAMQLSAAEAVFYRAQQAFEPDQHTAALRARDESLGRVQQLAERSAHTTARVEELQVEHKRLDGIRQDLARARATLGRIRTAEELTSFVRSVLRRAGPLVTEALLDDVSAAADEIFGDIIGDPSARLSWTSDYDIVLAHDGQERQFTQLSGGEQMSAALAVRLAILRELLKFDIAFFDEPTQHLDETRRSNLADQILRVRGFSQLVVITHDDAFERLLDGVIRIRKVAGRSIVEQV